MTVFLQTLFTMTLSATVAALAVMLLRLPLKKAPRWILCLLWLVVFIRMVSPVSFEAPVSLIPDEVASGAVGQQLLPPPASGPEIVTYLPPQAQLPAGPNDTTASTPAPSETPAAQQGPAPAHALFFLWAAGALGMFLRGVAAYLRLRRRLIDAVAEADGVYTTDQVDTPFVCGLFRPRIYLPTNLPENQRYYVLLHERVHIHRLDHLIKPLAWLALCLHWFNPILHLAFRLYSRDVETACDQAVIRAFDRQDTAGYAEALLCLGRRTNLPATIPLAFGEEDAKARIKNVLDYKNPSLFAALFALTVCVVTALLILANPGQDGRQLEGYQVTQVHVVHKGLSVELPHELGAELTALLDQHGHEDYVPSSEPLPREGMLVLTGQTDGTVYYFDPVSDTLTRKNHDGYSAHQKFAPMNPSLGEDPAYENWKTETQAYLETGRADALYALKTPYAGDPAAVGEILEAMDIQKVIGDYTIELQTDAEPYGLIIHIARGNPLVSFNSYHHAASEILFTLVGNLSKVTFASEGPFGSSQAISTQIFSTEEEYLSYIGTSASQEEVAEQLAEYQRYKTLTQEDFRPGFDRFQAETADMLGKLAVQTYQVQRTLYLPPDHSPGTVQSFPNLYDQSVFVISGDCFSATLVNALSSAWPDTETVENPLYDSTNGTENLTPYLDALWPSDRARTDPDNYIHAQGWRVLTSDHQDTGYRFYSLAYISPQVNLGQKFLLVGHESYDPETYGMALDWLFQVAPAES